jgi:phenylpropionate dioxygenase-like ring-hydroxylating dioxygenase large terminal subunit
MLSAEDNATLTRTGPGTAMGTLFRRFWMPVLLSRELPEPDGPPLRVTLLGEDLVAFRDTEGRVGLLDRHCPHRGADLFFGRNEACGIRCAYHGWKFDVTGECIDLPTAARDQHYDELRARRRTAAYPTREWGDMVWAYLGPPEQMPGLPLMEFALLPPSHRFVTKKLQECNWAQACEGALDTAHFSFLHANLTVPEPVGSDNLRTRSLHWMRDDPMPVFNVREHPAGLLLAASRRAGGNDLYWRVTQFLMPNHSLAPGSFPGATNVGQCWVPIDDRRCWVFVYSWHAERPLAEEERRVAPGVPSVHAMVDENWMPLRNRGNDYLIDRQAQKTRSFTGIEGLSEQDAAIQDSQGEIADRTREMLGPTDLGIVRFRRLVLGAARDLAAGIEPTAASAPEAYHVRSGGTVAPAGTAVGDVLRARFGDEFGRVPHTTA